MTVVVRDLANGKFDVDIRFKLPNGDPFRRRFIHEGSRTSAKSWGAARERDLFSKAIQAGGDKEHKEVPTLERFSERFIEEHARANRQKASGIKSKESILRIHLLPDLGSKRLDEINDSEVAKLKTRLRERSQKTVNNVLSVLSTMLRVAVEWGVLLEVPARIKLLKVQKRTMQFYEPTVYERLVEAAKAIGPSAELLVRLGGDAGLRRGEILALQRMHVDLVRGTVSVSRSFVKGVEGDTKGLEVRRVPMPPNLFALVRDHFGEHEGHLIHQPDGSRFTEKMVQNLMRKIERAADIPSNGRLHILRHTYCSHLAMAGVPVLEIQKLAGHQNLTTTMQYMHLSPNETHHRAVGLLTQLRAPSSS